MTINQALLKAVEAYKSGDVAAAKRLFSKIIQIEPNQPDANSNMGAILVASGDLEEALPYFQTALEADFSVAQYWFNYIEALFKLGRFTEASELMATARNKGCKGQAFDVLQEKLNSPAAAFKHNINGLRDLIGRGSAEEALLIATKLLENWPSSVSILDVMATANQKLGNLDAYVAIYDQILKLKPDDDVAYNNMGIVLAEQDKLEEAVEAFSKALSINSSNAETYNNLGNALQKQGQFEEAVEAYKKSVSINPDNAETYNNMGTAIKEQGELAEAIEVYKKAIAIKPDYAEAYNFIGVSLEDQGKPKEAIASFNKALSIQPDFAEALENFYGLAVQLLSSSHEVQKNLRYLIGQQPPHICSRPRYQILNAIKVFIEMDFEKTQLHLSNFRACKKAQLDNLSITNSVFCGGYSNFIGELLKRHSHETDSFHTEKKVYHLGESHCLSYAHHNIKIDNEKYKITPLITFGAKAFHFSRSVEDAYKSITQLNFAYIPTESNVFISFGEIDCRPNEGFITAATKLNIPVTKVINETVSGYLRWFWGQNESQNHRLFFFNVPAPVYNKEYSADLNQKVLNTVHLFNNVLKQYTKHYGFHLIDVFQFTVGDAGFSNGFFHIDGLHLGAKAITEIERQLR